MPADRSPLALPAERLKVGMVLPFTLIDGGGRVLLAKGQRIQDQQQLKILRERHRVFVPYEESDEAVKAWVVGFQEAERRDAALKDLDQYVRLDSVRAEKMFQGSIAAQCDELLLRLRRLLTGIEQGRWRGEEAREAINTFYAEVQWLLERPVVAEAATMVLTHRACISPADYSVLHALQCAVLAGRLAKWAQFDLDQTRSLVMSTATMNVAMLHLQDELAKQKSPPSPVQRGAIDEHCLAGVAVLRLAGIDDEDWLEAVRLHHDPLPRGPMGDDPPSVRMARIVQGLDRYTAAMSPRASRPGRASHDAVRTAVKRHGTDSQDPVGVALLQMWGLFPPGTFVQYKGGEVALVLRPGEKANAPVAAVVVNRSGEPVGSPKLADGRLPEFLPVSSVPGSLVRARINIDEMVKILVYSRTPAAELP
jgi:hypothetical protein